MKNVVLVFSIEFVVSAVFALFANDGVINYDFLTALGLINAIIGLLGVVIGLIIMISDKIAGRTLLLASGLLLLVGFLTCSFYPLRLNYH